MAHEKLLIDALEKEKPYIPTSDYEVGYNNGLVMAQAIALKLDAVEVVRCKDCVHQEHCEIEELLFHGENGNNPYCSYGERREG